MALLEIVGLTVTFDTAKGPFTAVSGFDLNVAAGEIVAIVGESGSGKSVAMLAAMGLLPPSAEVTARAMRFGGTDLRSLPGRARRRIVGHDLAMIFQEPVASLNPCFTVGFQIREVLRTHLGLDRRASRERALDLLHLVDIPDPARRLGAFPHQLSGGMNQRVMIAMAIACDPKLLIADEPTTALDVTIQAQIIELLAAIQARTGMALVLITHDMGVVAETAHRVVVQYAGEQVERQAVAGLFASPFHPYTRALLDALPDRATGNRLPAIPGIVPGQGGRPPGCVFHPRCARATEICRREEPPRQPAALGEALCHHPVTTVPA